MNRFAYFFIFLILVWWKAGAQVTVDINSGNPRFPFPQFLDYGSDRRTLASQNSPGVTHAEMEQITRDAWQIMANAFVYSGESHAGIQYIRGNLGCPYDCSEGDGYALLAAAEMGDKKTFDGLWMRIHDERMITYPRYRDCVVPNAGYQYGPNSLKDNTDAATDGSFDIALALLVGWKQWGDLMGVNDACGNPISYRLEALRVIRGLVEKHDRGLGDCRRVSGVIGFDGYIKHSNTGPGEMTGWATGMCPEGPEFTGPNVTHIDYAAPAYFRCFADFLQTQGGSAADLAWNINQFLRAEASSDWVMGQLYNKGPQSLPVAGWVGIDVANNTTFSNFDMGEDFRYVWRHVLSYVWHGNPTTSWNPVTKQVIPGGNTIERDMGIRFANFMSNPAQAPWNHACVNVGGGLALTFQGPSQIVQQYNPNTGAATGAFPLNWMHGTGAPAAIAAQDFDLMGKMFRQCVIEWDGTVGYLSSVPVYFHGFFRLLGLLTLSGNHHSPCDFVPHANIKVYKAVDKTYAYPGDTLTYTISYRNYASINATGVVITDAIPAGLTFVSASNGGSVSGGNVIWNIGTVPGLQNQNYNATRGSVTVRFRINNNATGRICNVANISCTNGTGWTSNEYPNNITDVMERNCVDIATRPLYIQKSSDVAAVNPGQTINYTLDFGNQPIPFINGGRPGVNVAFANNGVAPGTQLGLKFRLYHGADEAYINYRNYRISYFLQDATTTWSLANTIYEGGSAAGVTVTQQNLVPGSDATGSWNQRLIIRFANQLATTSPHLLRYSGLTQRIHQGGTALLRAVWNLHDAGWASHDWSDDWSATPAASAADGHVYFPITNNWADPYNPNIPVTKLHNEACQTSATTVNNILVEEWDGYTWRRIAGNGPVSGREVENVVLVDQLPPNVTFVAFTSTPAIGSTTYDAASRQIRWTAPLLRINEHGQIKYRVTANNVPCPVTGNIQNIASISGTNESPARDTNNVSLTCDCVPPPAPPATSMTKTVTSGAGPYAIGSSISYSITYTNTHGSIANPDLNSSTNWTRQSGTTNFNFGSNRVSTVSNQSTVMTYGYSHGTNGVLTGRYTFQEHAVAGIAMRHTGGAIGNGIYVTFKANAGAGNVEIRFWNGTTQVGAASTPAVSGLASGYFDYRIELNGGTISLWINNFSGAPLLSMTGMTVQAGYAGIINGTPGAADVWGTHHFSSWWTNLDSGFNVQMYDPIPSDITYVSSSNSGTVTGGILEWPMTNSTTTTPLLAGQTITRTWTGTVSTCNCGGVLANTAYMRILGVSPEPAAQVVVSCNFVTPVTYLSFTGKKQDKYNLLEWTTSSEVNSNYFAVERSDNGKDFQRIGMVKSYGNSSSPKNYSYHDYNSAKNNTYYRLAQYDTDGRYNHSEVIYLSGQNADVKIYPNPFSSETKILILPADEKEVTIKLFSGNGICINEYKVSEAAELTIGNDMAAGLYLLQVISGDQIQTYKIIKH
ncbi:MAG: glycosyl hydrolase family 8 [Cytophagaceae bacterium]